MSAAMRGGYAARVACAPCRAASPPAPIRWTPARPSQRVAPLVVRTVVLDLPDADLLDVLPLDDPVAWLRRGEGMVAWGRAAELRTRGTTRFADADKWWTETTSRAMVRDEVGEPGTGLVCFGTFAFADEPGRVRARRARDRGRPPSGRHLADHHRPRRRSRRPRPRGRPARTAGRRGLRRRRPRQRALDECRRRRGRADQRRRSREGRAGPRPGRDGRRTDRRAMAATPAGRGLPDVLDLPRRRALRRDAGDAGPPRARPGHLSRAGRHHPAYR